MAIMRGAASAHSDDSVTVAGTEAVVFHRGCRGVRVGTVVNGVRVHPGILVQID